MKEDTLAAIVKELGLTYRNVAIYSQPAGGYALAFSLDIPIIRRGEQHDVARVIVEAFEDCAFIQALKAERDRYKGMVLGLQAAVAAIREA